MKKFLLLAVLFCFCTGAFAQKVYFIYIQSEASMPFYVKMGEKVYSSTASGYLILPKLVDSTYSIYLGQPGNQAKELRFTVSLNNRDRGFLLKNLQNGLVLFDLQSMATVNPTASTSGVMYQTDVVKSDLFTRLLAKAVDDSTLLMEPVLSATQVVKKNTSEPAGEPVAKKQKGDPTTDIAALKPSEDDPIKSETINNDTVVSSNTVVQEPSIVNNSEQSTPVQTSLPIKTKSDQTVTAQTAPFKTDSVQTSVLAQIATAQNLDSQYVASQTITPSNSDQVDTSSEITQQTEYKRSVVKRYAESSNFQGFGLTYLDTWEGVTDTIRLMIPNVVEANYSATLPQSAENKSIVNSTKEEDKSTTVNQNSSDIITSDNNKTADSAKAVTDPTIISCKTTASDKDYKELRKNMTSKARGEEMLAEARKTFNNKCFTTEQIRNLSQLFLTSEGKLLFFKDAKSHISDKDRFETLIFEFNEDSYKDRFKTLVEN